MAASLGAAAGCSSRTPEPSGGAAPPAEPRVGDHDRGGGSAGSRYNGRTPHPSPAPAAQSHRAGLRLRQVGPGHQDGDLPARRGAVRLQRVHQRRRHADGAAGQHQRLELRAERRHAAQRRSRVAGPGRCRTRAATPPFRARTPTRWSRDWSQGATDVIRFTAPDSGTYRIICGVPGHALSGMWIWLKVDPAAKAPSFGATPK